MFLKNKNHYTYFKVSVQRRMQNSGVLSGCQRRFASNAFGLSQGGRRPRSQRILAAFCGQYHRTFVGASGILCNFPPYSISLARGKCDLGQPYISKGDTIGTKSHEEVRTTTRFRPLVGALERRRLFSADVLTYHNDNARSGVDSSETILSPANVNVSTFGKLGFDPVDGKVDAQPLYVAGVSIPGQGTHNVLYVATENDSVYAFDADTGAKLWQVSMLGPREVPSDPIHGSQVTPEIGITATPVIDLNTNTMYVVAMSKLVSGNTTTYVQRIHALDITTGADKVGPRSIDQSITYPGTSRRRRDRRNLNPMQYREHDALLLVNGVVYTSWASHSDVAPYTGWIIGFSANNLSVASVLNIDPNGEPGSSFLGDGSGNSFWNSGGGPPPTLPGTSTISPPTVPSTRPSAPPASPLTATMGTATSSSRPRPRA